MDNVSLLAEDSHGKKKKWEKGERSLPASNAFFHLAADHICGRNLLGQLFERTRSVASVKQNRVLSHFQFAQNTFYRELFHESIKSRLERHLSS